MDNKEFGFSTRTAHTPGLTLYNLGNDTGALTYLNKALAIDAKDEDALYQKIFLDKLGTIQALNNKAVEFNSLGNYTGAIMYYDKVLAIDPSDENTL